MINAALLGAYTAMSVVGLLLLKLGAPALRQLGNGLDKVAWTPLLQICIGAALYIGAFAVWLVILSRIELAVAYPVAIGLTLVFLSLASVLLLKESIGAMHFAGIVFIFLGIVMVTRAT